jgi:anti-anti-sigma factor
MNYIGIRERRIGRVCILDADSHVRIGLRFGAGAVPLSRAVQSLLDDGIDQILLNLERAPSIDADGLAEIASAVAATNRKGGRFKLSNLNECVREIMAKAKVLASFDVYDVESRAIESFKLNSDGAGNTQPSQAAGKI